MTVPEAAVDKNHLPPTWKYYVWGTWQIPSVETVSIAYRMQGTPNDQFWLRVLASNACHHRAALLRRHYVDHLLLPRPATWPAD
jgi:hypothetical protein